MNRKVFIKRSVLAGLGITIVPQINLPQVKEKPQPYPNNLIKEFVQAGHNNIDKVKEMLSEFPNLIYCRYDWGGGDFEEAIEGAGHLGNKEIAEYLIGQGARVNIFVLTMLGRIHVVKELINLYPEMLYTKGAHGFSLLHHARVGGIDSEELYSYFQEKGLKENKFDIHG